MAKDRPQSRLDRLIQTAIGTDRVLGKEDDKARELYPELWQWISRIYVGGGHVKQPAVITIRLGPDGVLATLTDRDLAVSLDVACPHLADVLASLEAALTSNTAPVRTWGKKEPQLRKRKSGS